MLFMSGIKEWHVNLTMAWFKPLNLSPSNLRKDFNLAFEVFRFGGVVC